MTTATMDPQTLTENEPAISKPAPKPIEHVSVICSKGTLDMAYPGLILANAARMSGIGFAILSPCSLTCPPFLAPSNFIAGTVKRSKDKPH